jgi:hypothetical protein
LKIISEELFISWRSKKQFGENVMYVAFVLKRPGPLQRGDNHKNVKMGWGHLKIFFFETMNPESDLERRQVG